MCNIPTEWGRPEREPPPLHHGETSLCTLGEEVQHHLHSSHMVKEKTTKRSLLAQRGTNERCKPEWAFKRDEWTVVIRKPPRGGWKSFWEKTESQSTISVKGNTILCPHRHVVAFVNRKENEFNRFLHVYNIFVMYWKCTCVSHVDGDYISSLRKDEVAYKTLYLLALH